MPTLYTIGRKFSGTKIQVLVIDIDASDSPRELSSVISNRTLGSVSIRTIGELSIHYRFTSSF